MHADYQAVSTVTYFSMELNQDECAGRKHGWNCWYNRFFVVGVQ